MKKNTTEIVFILDKSGSMAKLQKDTVVGFNTMIEKQKNHKGECYVSTILFNENSKVLYNRLKLKEVPIMTTKDYNASGYTALMDAVGDAINHVATVHENSKLKDIPKQTLFVITTDGYENASHKYNSEILKEMIEEKKKRYGWEFLFIGANIDAIAVANKYGIGSCRAANYNADALGVQTVYNSVAKVAYNICEGSPISDDWCNEINNDFLSRRAS